MWFLLVVISSYGSLHREQRRLFSISTIVRPFCFKTIPPSFHSEQSIKSIRNGKGHSQYENHYEKTPQASCKPNKLVYVIFYSIALSVHNFCHPPFSLLFEILDRIGGFVIFSNFKMQVRTRRVTIVSDQCDFLSLFDLISNLDQNILRIHMSI